MLHLSLPTFYSLCIQLLDSNKVERNALSYIILNRFYIGVLLYILFSIWLQTFNIKYRHRS